MVLERNFAKSFCKYLDLTYNGYHGHASRSGDEGASSWTVKLFKNDTYYGKFLMPVASVERVKN